MFWAKKFRDGKKQTIKEHTGELLRGVRFLKEYYGYKLPTYEEFWDALLLAVVFHDLGKASETFQAKIEGRRVPCKEVPHNFLSASLLDKNLLRKTKRLERPLREALYYAVAFHHDRKLAFGAEDFKSIVAKDLKEKEEKLRAVVFSLLREFGKEDLVEFFAVPDGKKAEKEFDKVKDYFLLRRDYRKLKAKFKGKEREAVILKGLLHRLDHSASAGVPVEEKPHANRLVRLEEYLLKKRSKEKKFEFRGFKSFQLKGRELKESSVLLEAPTGSGKTEFALNWLDDDKGFYTLPVRTAVNSMFERLRSVFGTVGLLHGDRALYYLLNGEEDEEKQELSFSLTELNLSTHLAFPLTVSTADQLFSSVFKYPGFEKVYATLAYSKTVIDEPQGYTPKTLAAVVKAVEEVKELGGQFAVMSATLYPFVKERLVGLGFEEVDATDLYETSPVKHRLELLESFDFEVLTRVEGKSVLIVVNTVRRAVELYLKIKEEGFPVRLLHSRFVQADRRRLESQIEKEAEKGLPVIWVTTQVAEASLDVDFSVLITEVAPLDAVVQRMGRVNRRGKVINPDFVNVFVLRENSDKKGKVYSRDLVSLALEGIERWDGKLVAETAKRELVRELYGRENLRVRTPAFLREFDYNLSLLESGLQAESRSQAQEYFREVTTIPVIPEGLFEEKREEVLSLVDRLRERNQPFEERLKVQAQLRGHTVNLYPYQFKSFFFLHDGVVVAKGVQYDRELGALLDDEGAGGEFI